MENSLKLKLCEGGASADPFNDGNSENIEILRLKVLDHVRYENPQALKNPRENDNYLRVVASMAAAQLKLPAGGLVDGVVDDIMGYGPLYRFIFPIEEKYREVTEVMVTSYSLVYVEIEGELYKVPVCFRDQPHLIALMSRLAMTAGDRIDLSKPMAKVKLPDGSRACMFIPPASSAANMTIRRFPRSLTYKDLLERGAITPEVLSFFRECAKEGMNTYFTGGMGSGKTTVLNAFIELISETWSPQTSIVTMEDVSELQPRHENLRRVFSRQPNLDGKGRITLAQLAESELLAMRPDWIIWGEYHGKETYYGVQMGNMGHPTAGTMHSHSAVDMILYRMPGMYRQSEEAKNMSDESILRQIAGVVDVVAHNSKVRLGKNKTRRQVVEIVEVLADSTSPHKLFEFNRESKKLEQVADPKVFGKKMRWL